MNIVATMNAGYIPPEVRVHDLKAGGRIIGEACHFIDLCTYWRDLKWRKFAYGFGAQRRGEHGQRHPLEVQEWQQRGDQLLLQRLQDVLERTD